jgi:hypothetical protein
MDDFMTAVAKCEDERKNPNTFFFRYTIDEDGKEIKVDNQELDRLVLE